MQTDANQTVSKFEDTNKFKWLTTGNAHIPATNAALLLLDNGRSLLARDALLVVEVPG